MVITRKTDIDLQNKVFWVAKKLVETDGYIKGFGNKDRLMTGDHSPIENIETKVTKCLVFNKLLMKYKLTFVTTEKIKQITSVEDIEIEL